MEKDDPVNFLKKSIEGVGLIEAANISENDLSSLDEGSSLLDALELSRENPKEIIAVTSSGKIVGTLSKLEIISKIFKKNISSLDKILIKDVMNKNFASCFENETLENIYNDLIKASVEGVVLVKGDEFKGIIDCFDLIRVFENTKFMIENPPLLNGAMRKDIFKIQAEDNLWELKKRFVNNKSNYCIVYLREEVVGIVTIKDLLGSLCKNIKLDNVEVQSIMSAGIMTMEGWKNIGEAMKLMLEKKFNQLPVGENGKIIGMLGICNAIVGYYSFLQELIKDDYGVKEVF